MIDVDLRPLVVLALWLSPAPSRLPGGWGATELQGQQPAPAFRADAAFRPGYHGAWRSDRDGSTSETHDLRMRAQLGGWWLPQPSLAVRARAAGRLSTEQRTLRFYVSDYVPATDGLRQGEFTLDEAYVRWRPSERLQLRAGRMQTSFELVGVPRKSLDRNDSPNTDVTWTDGVHASVLVCEGWRQHVIVQRHGSRGPTNVIRPPLDVTGADVPVALFALTQLEARRGAFIQREVGVTYMPGIVEQSDGATTGDYTALVLRGAVQAPGRVAGGRVVVGAELGLAAGTPTRDLLGTGTPGEQGDGWAFQVSANLMEAGKHSFGIVHSQAGDGWLISSDIRDNNREIEGRYYLQYARWGRLDVRFRYREDMRMRVGALERRRDRDVYVRTTLRF